MADYDLMFRNLAIIDGTGAPAFQGDLAVTGDQIAAVGRLKESAREVIDCQGLYAAPGLIDIHTHGDYTIFSDPLGRNFISQGVTTILTGQCGLSSAPVSPLNPADKPALEPYFENGRLTFEAYQRAIEDLGPGLNLAALAGHANVRGAVMGPGDRKAGPQDLAAMRAEVRAAMEAGAFGLSTGLIYDPCLYAGADELAALAEAAAEYGGFFAAHIRDESGNVVPAVQEIIDVGRRSGARIQISHHKACGRLNHGLVRLTLDLMDYYNGLGSEITCDMYPCVYCATDLYSFFPLWTRREGRQGFIDLTLNEEKRWELVEQLKRPGIGWENGILDAGFDEIIVTQTRLENVSGKSLVQLAAEWKLDHYEAMFELLRRDIEVMVISGGISEEDVKYVISHPLGMAASDGYIYGPGTGLVHPRSYRAFTKVLAQYARDEKLMTVPEAVRKMSLMPAWKMGLPDRGLIRPGFRADLFIFDLWGLKFLADYTDPHRCSEGAAHVLVNGGFAIRDGALTEEKHGRVLRKNNHRT